MPAKLIVHTEEGRKKTHRLGKREAVIGRSADADLRLDDSFVSRRHCRLKREATGWRLDDLGSSNGTYLAGRRLSGSARLETGATFTLGRSKITFEEKRRISGPFAWALSGSIAALVLILALSLFWGGPSGKRRVLGAGGGGGTFVATATPVDIASYEPAGGNRIRMDVPPLPEDNTVRMKKRTVKIRGKFVREPSR